jgi:hypothetical protein
VGQTICAAFSRKVIDASTESAQLRTPACCDAAGIAAHESEAAAMKRVIGDLYLVIRNSGSWDKLGS